MTHVLSSDSFCQLVFSKCRGVCVSGFRARELQRLDVILGGDELSGMLVNTAALAEKQKVLFSSKGGIRKRLHSKMTCVC